MIRLTVLYNLAEGQSEASFIEWRLSDHQQHNQSIPGVVRTDFARITDSWPAGATPEFQFQTTVDWPDRESFEKGFNSDAVQTRLIEDLKRLGDHTFLISEILAESSN